MFWRLGVGVAFGSIGYLIVAHCGFHPVAQGFVFALLVYIFARISLKIPQSGIGTTFATLALVYAVCDNFR